MSGTGWAAPQRAVDTVIANLPQTADKIMILDTGCGTGAVGECFAKSSIMDRLVIDGSDLTQGMLDVARKKEIYRNLETADLSKPLEVKDASYDVVTCIGTLTKAHVGPEVFSEFSRITKMGGLIVAGVHQDIWESGGYRRAVESLSGKSVQIISTEPFGMLEGATEGGIMVVLRSMVSTA